ncbi:MAG: homoserine kinase [Candidatus Thermoplasmatota archaeon]|nr:homoserine kinase [Candidatus Thermoplasmatota archaeon]
MRLETAMVTSPATIANFGPGFDSFGLCLDSPLDRISVRRAAKGRIVLRVTGKYEVPSAPEENTASYAAMRLAELCDKGTQGFTMTVRKGMKPGSGIGSSAASSVGGALAMAALLGVKDKGVILEAAAMGEELISGVRHYDNVAAALHGGFTAVVDAEARKIITIKPPALQIVVLMPDISVKTRDARAILPKKVTIDDAVRNLSFASGMVHAMMRRDVRAIGSYLDDRLSVPYRKKLVPGFDAVRENGLEAGALGVSLAGSGPAIFALAERDAGRIKLAMTRALRSTTGLESKSFVTKPGGGAKVESIS